MGSLKGEKMVNEEASTKPKWRKWLRSCIWISHRLLPDLNSLTHFNGRSGWLEQTAVRSG